MESSELSKLLDLMDDPGQREEAKRIILENFDEKISVKYNRSLKHLEKEFSSKMLKDDAKAARICAFNIIEEFGDFDPINNINQIKLIVETQIKLTEGLSG